jgi:hypothetical protein
MAAIPRFSQHPDVQAPRIARAMIPAQRLTLSQHLGVA